MHLPWPENKLEQGRQLEREGEEGGRRLEGEQGEGADKCRAGHSDPPRGRERDDAADYTLHQGELLHGQAQQMAPLSRTSGSPGKVSFCPNHLILNK